MGWPCDSRPNLAVYPPGPSDCSKRWISLGRWGFLNIAMESRGLWSGAQREAKPSHRRKKINQGRDSESQNQGQRVGGWALWQAGSEGSKENPAKILGRRHGRGRIWRVCCGANDVKTSILPPNSRKCKIGMGQQQELHRTGDVDAVTSNTGKIRTEIHPSPLTF